MGLATVIRLEFAYPGVGILAGDSLQYLSTATAHGVIMVFYMIMPAIFGAFGNFLLPTQLGVHDVAFPRLNSAAFWFLPGGLIMLFQLVCTDRRYARMNCFNIRELQGMLKRKYFTDLMNTLDHRMLIGQSMINLRYKANSDNNLGLDFFNFQNFGLHILNSTKSVSLDSNTNKKYTTNIVFLDYNNAYFLLYSKDVLKEFLYYFYKDKSGLFLTNLMEQVIKLLNLMEIFMFHVFKNSIALGSLTSIFV